jgi:hypothetical protein
MSGWSSIDWTEGHQQQSAFDNDWRFPTSLKECKEFSSVNIDHLPEKSESISIGINTVVSSDDEVGTLFSTNVSFDETCKGNTKIFYHSFHSNDGDSSPVLLSSPTTKILSGSSVLEALKYRKAAGSCEDSGQPMGSEMAYVSY